MKFILPLVLVILSMFGFVSCGTPKKQSTEFTSASPRPTATLTESPNNTDSPLSINYKETNLTMDHDVIVLDINQNKMITLTVTSNSINTSDLQWESNHPKIASVDAEGLVTGLSEGNCLVTVSVKDKQDISASVQITVNGLSTKTTKKPAMTPHPHNTQRPQKVTTPQKTNKPVNTIKPKTTPKPTRTPKPTLPPPKKTQSPKKEEVYFDTKGSEEVLNLVNQERTKEGLAPLQLNDNITEAAEIRATEIVTKFDSIRPNGTESSTVLEDCGITFISSQENMGAGQAKPENLMENWLASSEHKANILNPDFKETGIACFFDSNRTYRYYWVQIFIE